MNQREMQRLETRRTLAEHALRLFQAKGYDETTVEEIAAAAGVSPRTFFLHFATKSAAAFPDHDERVVAFTESLGDGDKQANPLLHLCQVMAAGLDTTTPSRRIRYTLLDKVSALRDEDARTDRDYEQLIAAYLLQAWGDTVEARVRAHAVANASLGVARASLIASSVEGIDPQQVCFELMLRMFCSPFDVSLHSLKQD